MSLGDKPVAKKRKASIIPFPFIDIVNHWNGTNQHRQVEPIVKQGTIDGSGYGKGFHDLSDIISHILKHHHTGWISAPKFISQHHDFTDDGYRLGNPKVQSLSAKSLRDKRRKIRKERFRLESGLRRGSGRKFAPPVTKVTQEPFPSTARLLPTTRRLGRRVNSSTKIRNLRRQLARIRAKLNRYLRLAHSRKRKTWSLPSSTNRTDNNIFNQQSSSFRTSL